MALAELRAEIDQFYAQHMHLLDAGDVERWAETFTRDAVLTLPVLAEPLCGRQSIVDGARRAAERNAAAKEVHRHWHGMMAVTPDPVERDVVRVRCYALVFVTRVGEAPLLHRTCVCTDTLVKYGGSWLVRERTVTRDDLP